jgi:uncharacterized protein (DUF362 family)
MTYKTDRRTVLKLGATLAGAALVPGCAHTGKALGTTATPDSLSTITGDQPHVSSYWTPHAARDQSYDRFTKVVESATDFGWLSRGDRVFLKISLNSDRPYPATTDPWLVGAMIRLLQEKGAGVISVGDQSGMEHVYQSATKLRGSSRECCEHAGILASIDALGATPVFFEEAGYDAFRPTTPRGAHHWPEPLWVPTYLDQVDHIVYLARVSSHATADATLGFKIGVGFLRCDSRFAFHRGGGDFSAMYQEVNDVPEIADKLRLVVSNGTEVLSTIGPDIGHVATPDYGLVMASTDLLAHEQLAYAWLLYNRFHETRPSAKSLDHTVADMRSPIHKLFMSAVGTRAEHGSVTAIPGFRPGHVAAHPALMNHMQRRGGRPESIHWDRLDAHPDAAVTEFLRAQI